MDFLENSYCSCLYFCIILYLVVVAGSTIILGAAYMLRVFQRAFMGEVSEHVANFKSVSSLI
jgi:NADH:ubiquinone oxidoreductase subunit 4 (subunit M)